MSAKDALDRYYKKDAEKQRREQFGTPGRKRRNERPEMELTQKPCKSWFRKNDWSMFIIDSKAEYNANAELFVAREDVPAGFTDAVGCAPDGTAAFVEFKAPGRRSGLREHQREFILDKINKGCFAVVVDSVQGLAQAWPEFKANRALSRNAAINYLIRLLPRSAKIQSESETLFE